ncbi:MAG: tetratricopeptide repeat protein [Desulfobacterales bacterium]|jgi:tetratricopeptide (TPR) repeat protein|nr:tetratricopeptide repeat protein [Desulfobacterales bacterium]
MATRKRRKITRRAETSRHFLLSQADSRKVDESPEVGAERVRQTLTAAYPDVRCGADFLTEVLRSIGVDRPFCALWIRPDDPPETWVHAPGSDVLTGVAACLDEICRSDDGVWGVAESGMLIGIWPSWSGAQGLDAAHRLQEQVRQRTGRTVTIGVASHPTLDYMPAAALENARKAAEHAAFFGAGSRAVFDAVSLNISGDKYYERGDIPNAIREFELALRMDPQNGNVHNSLGVCYGELGDHEAALEAFGRALSVDGSDYMAVYNTGLIHELRGDREKALAHFLKACALHGDVFEILFQTGKLRLEMGDSQAARPMLERAVRLRPRSGSSQRLLGDCYAQLQLADNAIDAYKKAVKANPGDSSALSALGGLFDEKGENPDIALVFCKESVRLSPDNPLFRRRLGCLYLKLSRLEEALSEFEQAGRLGQDCAADIHNVRERMAERS